MDAGIGRLASHAPLTFDLSTFDLFAASTAGAAVVLVPRSAAMLPAEIVRFVNRHGITVWYSVPTILALLADPVLLAAGLAWAGIVVAWGWPALFGSSSRFGSSLAIGITGVLAPAAAAATTGEPYLRFVPVALVIGLAVMFGHQMVRRDGSPRLTESIGITSLGLAVIALGTTWMPLSRTSRATDIAVIGSGGAESRKS